MGDAHHCSGPPVSEMTYTVSSGTLNPSIPYHTIHAATVDCTVMCSMVGSATLVPPDSRGNYRHHSTHIGAYQLPRIAPSYNTIVDDRRRNGSQGGAGNDAMVLLPTLSQ